MKNHYENFPVASWLCPPRLRAPIAAIYHFARTADDLADEGDRTAEHRLLLLRQYREALITGKSTINEWQALFVALSRQIELHDIPMQPLLDLLDAFEQDVIYTAQQRRYQNLDELLNYCHRSANPVGRLLLHLYGVNDALALQRSDHICTALQLINFWQDLSVDIPRQRHYMPLDIETRFADQPHACLAYLLNDAEHRMQQGQALVHQVPGRAGWELRLVVQGGLQVLQKVRRLGPQAWNHRPQISGIDAPLLLWRAVWM